MRFHGSCAARPGSGGYDAVLLLGAPGSGKSDLLLRLLDRGWALVADDQVVVEAGIARGLPALLGFIEIRGLGVFRVPHIAGASLRLAVRMGRDMIRLPEPMRHEELGVPEVILDPMMASAAIRVGFALDAVVGQGAHVVGAFAA